MKRMKAAYSTSIATTRQLLPLLLRSDNDQFNLCFDAVKLEEGVHPLLVLYALGWKRTELLSVIVAVPHVSIVGGSG
jgi:hypothetical protein